MAPAILVTGKKGRQEIGALKSEFLHVSPLSVWKVLIEKLQVQSRINCNDLRVKSLKRSMVWRKGNNDIYSGGGLITQLCLDSSATPWTIAR